MRTELALFLALVWLLPTIVAGRIGDAKNRRGWPWGLFLSWLGVIILLALPGSRRPRSANWRSSNNSYGFRSSAKSSRLSNNASEPLP
jgi:hypothetical protein